MQACLDPSMQAHWFALAQLLESPRVLGIGCVILVDSLRIGCLLGEVHGFGHSFASVLGHL